MFLVLLGKSAVTKRRTKMFQSFEGYACFCGPELVIKYIVANYRPINSGTKTGVRVLSPQRTKHVPI
jgi:hypothetical protein